MKHISQKHHNCKIQENLRHWKSKPLLKKIYIRFYNNISKYLQYDDPGCIVEIGAGIGNLRSVISECLCTDLFPNPWIDQVENAYELSFSDSSISNLVLFDVWHHLKFPGSALKEFYRVLIPRGRVIIFEPDISILGFIVYGLFHTEPINFTQPIQCIVPNNFSSIGQKYYCVQGNATRIFCLDKYLKQISDWKQVITQRISSISYVTSGGYGRPQLYPDLFLPFLSFIDRILNNFLVIFSTRMLVVLEKK